MALILTQYYKGVEANYWKIIRSTNDCLENKTITTIALYLNKATRESDTNNYLRTDIYPLKGNDLTRVQQYTALKELEVFLTAEDN